MTTEERQQKEREFLIGLTELTRKTGIEICGCGCCGSPTLNAAEGLGRPESGYAQCSGQCDSEVKWVSRCDEWDWERHAAEIVREVA